MQKISDNTSETASDTPYKNLYLCTIGENHGDIKCLHLKHWIWKWWEPVPAHANGCMKWKYIMIECMLIWQMIPLKETFLGTASGYNIKWCANHGVRVFRISSGISNEIHNRSKKPIYLLAVSSSYISIHQTNHQRLPWCRSCAIISSLQGVRKLILSDWVVFGLST